MKKTVSFILVLAALMFCLPFTVFADASLQSNDLRTDELSAELYKEEFVKQCCETYPGNPKPWLYKELYYHHDEKGDTDWVLMLAAADHDADYIDGDAVIIGHWAFVFTHGFDDPCFFPFKKGYGIYDLKEDCFYDVTDIDVNTYGGIVEAFDEVFQGRRYIEDDQENRWEVPMLIGDIDNDSTLTILDATMIQRCLADLEEFPYTDSHSTGDHMMPKEQKYRSDYDRDGYRTILDATAIQRKLAGLS